MDELVSDQVTVVSDICNKVLFYFTNILEFLPVFRLRQKFEVCGILTVVFVARQRNSYGQVYGFVRLFECEEC